MRHKSIRFECTQFTRTRNTRSVTFRVYQNPYRFEQVTYMAIYIYIYIWGIVLLRRAGNYEYYSIVLKKIR
jgi:hypothetical protein